MAATESRSRSRSSGTQFSQLSLLKRTWIMPSVPWNVQKAFRLLAGQGQGHMGRDIRPESLLCPVIGPADVVGRKS